MATAHRAAAAAVAAILLLRSGRVRGAAVKSAAACGGRTAVISGAAVGTCTQRQPVRRGDASQRHAARCAAKG
ncbi:MAG: hypothetical protein EOO41_04915, partial [Methanobacteriota archaeon]